MHTRLTKRSRATRHGTTTVEFALTAPIVFMLLMGALEFSRANILRHTVVVAATEGARSSIVPGATADECEQATVRELAIVGFTDVTVTVDPTVIVKATKEVTINVTVAMSGENGFVLPRFLSGVTISKSVTLQRETAVIDPGAEG